MLAVVANKYECTGHVYFFRQMRHITDPVVLWQLLTAAYLLGHWSWFQTFSCGMAQVFMGSFLSFAEVD